MTDDAERLVAEIPPELKRLVDADARTNRDVVIDALWTEFGGERKGAIDRRIDEVEQRLSMVKRERNDRDRELEELREALESLRTKREEAQSEREQQLEAATEALENLGSSRYDRPDENNQIVQHHAEQLDMDAAALLSEVFDGE